SHVDAVKSGFNTMNVERVFCLIRVVQLLRDKYSFDNGSLSAKIDGNLRIPKPWRDAFATASESGDDYKLLDTTLDILEHLKLTILSGGETSPQENIYYKRHVAAGIPSMYGEYREPRFDALGLSFRVERLTCRLFGRMADQVKGDYISKEFLWSVTNALQKFRRALDIDGLLKDSYSLGVELLQKCLDSYRINYYQFRNIIKQFIAPAVHGLVEGPVFGEYAEAAVRIHRNKLLAVVPKESFGPNATAEVAVREMLATSVALQELDAFVTRICNVADEMARKLDPDRLSRILNFRAQRLVTFIHEDLDALSDPMHLGSKGFSLKRMARFGFKVPPGFIISTELYSIREALAFDPVAKDIRARLYAAFDRLEKESGKRFGDPANLLMLSVRSSGTNSMPGMMATFLNVGLNDAIVEELSHESNYGWTSWDCYRRFLQCWGMSEGIDRDDFDSIISKFKEKYNVKVKIEFSGAIMREIAYAYKNLLTERGLSIPEDPREQVLAVVYKVLSSWDNASAKVYRRQMDIAEDWGTAVVVQQMVLGNINYDSGTGVMFTHPPSSRGLNIQLEGEYVFCSQGEDVVAGLVFPYPLSEWQRREQKIHRNASGSLETHLPGIYSKLLEVSRDMVLDKSFEHQEIEFTFETSSAKDLYILQTRPMVFDDEKRRKLFEDPDSIWSDWLAAGLGSGGGAFTGRVAIGETDIQMVSSLYTGDPLLLVRPDTVPDDIHLIVTAEALLTARGGGTSHAAITAKRLGKVCVVNCPRMEVDETRSEVRFGDRVFRPGDWLSINGDTGDIFAGKHPVK
ncbi:MAG: PEP/pyruvate-binding domain-containing protein, partial [Candidatus Brocadiia bacterium]